MIFKTKIQGEYVDRRHFCVIAAEKPSQLRAFLGRRRVCYRQKIVIVLPGNSVRNVSRLKTLFNRSWKAGTIDVLVVLSDSRCRVFSIVTSHEKDAFCDAPKFALTYSWEKNQSCSLYDSTVKYFPKYKISGLNNCNLNVFARSLVHETWSTLLHFLEFSMDARFNINTTIGESFLSHTTYPPQILVANMRVSESHLEHFILSSYIEKLEHVYVVPRVLTVSVDWFRILNELSGNVWLALVVISLLSAGTSYLLADDGKDLMYVILFTVQPLFEKSWKGQFLSWRGRMFFTLWLFFCVILTTSYTSTFLSQLTVPSTTDAIKSFDDLVKSGLPVHAHMHKNLAKHYQTLPLFKPIMNRTTFLFQQKLQKDQHNIAYLIGKRDSSLFAGRSYRLLPEILFISYEVPLRMTRYPLYERVFEIAFMRAVQAGALEAKLQNDKEKQLKIRQSQRGDHRKPISLRSFLPVFVVWSIGCGIAFSVFLLEYCSRLVFIKTAAV